jgi:hypothetical protein
VFSLLDVPDVPTWLGYPLVTIVSLTLGFLLKKQRVDDEREAHLVPVLIRRIDKMERDAAARIEKVEEEARAARAETAEVRDLHVQCLTDNAAMKVEVTQLRADVKQLQDRAKG